jgi:hypothetical protein
MLPPPVKHGHSPLGDQPRHRRLSDASKTSGYRPAELHSDDFAPPGQVYAATGADMGDCFAYACADSVGLPILFKGDGFPQTDIAIA